MKRGLAIELICSFFIFLFVYSAITKVREIERVASNLQVTLLDVRWAKVGAIGLICSEFLISGFLFFKKFRKPGLWMSLLLMLVFTVYITWLLLKGSRLPCTCGGLLEYLSWKQHLLFNIFCILLTIVGLIRLTKMERRFHPSLIAQD